MKVGSTYSTHTVIRRQKRGISQMAVQLVLDEGDLIEPAGDHCERIRLSRLYAGRLRIRGVDQHILDTDAQCRGRL